jgi:hypothetical protein
MISEIASGVGQFLVLAERLSKVRIDLSCKGDPVCLGVPDVWD